MDDTGQISRYSTPFGARVPTKKPSSTQLDYFSPPNTHLLHPATNNHQPERTSYLYEDFLTPSKDTLLRSDFPDPEHDPDPSPEPSRPLRPAHISLDPPPEPPTIQGPISLPPPPTIRIVQDPKPQPPAPTSQIPKSSPPPSANPTTYSLFPPPTPPKRTASTLANWSLSLFTPHATPIPHLGLQVDLKLPPRSKLSSYTEPDPAYPIVPSTPISCRPEPVRRNNLVKIWFANKDTGEEVGRAEIEVDGELYEFSPRVVKVPRWEKEEGGVTWRCVFPEREGPGGKKGGKVGFWKSLLCNGVV
ncbi:hypothetical protein BJ508DRAFT_321404 [Ascobolus immersus RN42]|uniref:Uncharacterized protein n=1 Tax=Ascobolus immersus RN42 TaxID=1160509 RepID=A0A3N4IYU6_ASCIM|nr:hypothetical protein BJ508DRAFT_321404 [Ascobolus immersus RN42]